MYRINNAFALLSPLIFRAKIPNFCYNLRVMAFEASFLLWIQENLRCSFLSSILVPYTMLGNFGQIWIAFIIFLFIFPKTRKAGLLTLIAFFASWLLNEYGLKLLVNRTRPFLQISELTSLVPAPYGSSFPSGHSATSFACALAILLTTNKKIGIPALCLSFVMAFSRLYVGVHYPTDVLAGIAFGSLIGFLVVFIAKKVPAKKQKENKNDKNESPENP